MRLVLSGIFIIGLALQGGAIFAHLCNNIYRTPDRVIVKPEKDVAKIAKSDKFRIFVKNNYPTVLNDFKLYCWVEGDAVQIEVSPKVITILKPGEKTAFKVKVEVKKEPPEPSKYILKVAISAKQLGFQPIDEPTIGALRKVATEGWGGCEILAAESLAKLKDRVGIDCLTKWALSRNRDTRTRAIRAIGRVTNKELAAILKELLKDRDGLVRGNALISLGMLNIKSELSTIQKFLGDRDRFVQSCAVAAMAIMGYKTTIPYLRQLLSDSDVYVRIAAGWGLSALGIIKEGVPVLEQAFGSGDTLVRIFAGDALLGVSEKL